MNDILQILSIVGSAVFMVFFFGLCIFVHELGHFLAAKWRGLHVTAFSIGFRKIWGRTYRGVEYRIGWVPFGGYVEIPQIDATGSAKDEKGVGLKPAKPFDRMIAVVAGPAFNFLFGFLVAAVIWIVGIPQDSPDMKEVEVARIVEDSPEYRAGLRAGDVIVRLNGNPLNTTWSGVFKDILTTVGPVRLTVRRGAETLEISYIPAVNKNVMPDEEIAYPFFDPKFPIVVYPEKGSIAEKAGLRKGDLILSVNGKQPTAIHDFETFIDETDGKSAVLRVQRGKTEFDAAVIPEPVSVNGRAGTWQAGVYYSPSAEIMTVLNLIPGTPAEKAGLRKDDKILKADGETISAAMFPFLVQKSEGKPMKLTVERDGKELEIELAPVLKKFYGIGVEYAYIAHPTPWAQFVGVMDLTWKSMRAIGYSLGRTAGLTEQETTVKAKHMSGPIGIGRILYRSVKDGSLMHGLNIVVMITFSLGLLNLLPIPVLDGGHFFLALLEIIFRRPVPEAFLKPITYVFVTVIVGFMLFVTFYDAKRVIGDFAPQTLKTPKPAAAAAPGK